MEQQFGIYKVVLKENTGREVFYENGVLAGISTTGETITLSSCDNIYLNYEHTIETGASGKGLNEFVVNVSVFDLTVDTLNQLNSLSSIFGYIPIFYFYNGDVKALLTPLFLEQDFEYNEQRTQVFNIKLNTQVKTTNILIDYEEIISGQGIQAEDESFILAESGDPILTD